MLEIQCTSCGSHYRIAKEHQGKQVRCPGCGNIFVAQAAHANEPPVLASTAVDAAKNNADTHYFAPTSSQGYSGNRPRTADEIDYEIFGDDMQYVEVTLDPGETVIAEAGAMMFMSSGIEMQTVFGDPSKKGAGFWDKMVAAGKRAITGESLFMTTFSNIRSAQREVVAFGAPYSGKILPMHLDQIGGEIICQKDAFLCGAKGIEVSIAFQKKIATALFGGEGFIMQRLRGDGVALVHASGTMHHRVLKPGEQLRVDTGCLMAMGPTVDYDIQFVGGFKNTLFGGEGLFMATLTGPGPIWLQSLPFSRLAGRMLRAARTGGKDEGSVLNNFGGLGNMFMGNNDG
jgi:uncharacterized protein (TIGR00266 family)